MQRVVITGLGVISPIGNNLNDFWVHIKEGQHGIKPLSRFDGRASDIHVAAEVNDFHPETILSKKDLGKMDRFSQFAVAAADEALKDSGYEITEKNAFRVGTLVSAANSSFEMIQDNVRKMDAKGPKRIEVLFTPKVIANMPAANVSMQTGARGVSMSIASACATGTHSVGEAFLKIKYGLLDAAFAGGTDASINEIAISAFANLKALSNSQDPNRASMPFDKERDGFVVGEGAGVLFMESLESALKRQAPIYAEIVGYGATSDADHLTHPREDGSGIGEAMLQAMAMAGIEPSQIDYINAHGTGTEVNDATETTAIKYAFNDEAYFIAVSSSKGYFGHMFGAAGAVEAIVTVKALQAGFIPPTIGLNHVDPACDLDYVPHTGRYQSMEYAMSNSLGFGGQNSSLLFKHWHGD